MKPTNLRNGFGMDIDQSKKKRVKKKKKVGFLDQGGKSLSPEGERKKKLRISVTLSFPTEGSEEGV